MTVVAMPVTVTVQDDRRYTVGRAVLVGGVKCVIRKREPAEIDPARPVRITVVRDLGNRHQRRGAYRRRVAP